MVRKPEYTEQEKQLFKWAKQVGGSFASMPGYVVLYVNGSALAKRI